MKEITIVIASVILSVSIYLSAIMLVEGHQYEPIADHRNATNLTVSIIEQSGIKGQSSLEEITKIHIDTYEKVLVKLIELEE